MQTLLLSYIVPVNLHAILSPMNPTLFPRILLKDLSVSEGLLLVGEENMANIYGPLRDSCQHSEFGIK